MTKYISDYGYKFLISSREMAYKKWLAEHIKKSKKPVYIWTRQGIIEGKEWLKKNETR